MRALVSLFQSPLHVASSIVINSPACSQIRATLAILSSSVHAETQAVKPGICLAPIEHGPSIRPPAAACMQLSASTTAAAQPDGPHQHDAAETSQCQPSLRAARPHRGPLACTPTASSPVDGTPSLSPLHARQLSGSTAGTSSSGSATLAVGRAGRLHPGVSIVARPYSTRPAPLAQPLPAPSPPSSHSPSRVMPSDETLQAREQAKAQASGNKRFFRTVEVREAPAPSAAEPARDSGGYALYLGKYPIKTPGRRLLVLPSRALALAVAAEWEWQESSKPAMHSMPLMGLAATAIDQPKPREKVVETLLKYIHTDSALCRYEEGKMAQRQAQVFDPLLEWARATFGWSSLHSSDSIFGTQQEPEVVQGAQALLLSLDPWRLAAVEQLTYCSKSLLLALALLHGRIDRTQALTAARLEELTQCEEWGEVEAGHDLDSADIGSRVTAALVLIRLMDAHAKRTAPAAGGVK